jgi:enoyl-CoA hydratase/carnithine racemase
LLTGRPIDAATAADWGLVNAVVAPEGLEAATRELAAQIASAAGFVIGLGKAAFYAQIDLDQPKAYAYAKEVMSMNALAADAQEGMSAFISKRAPAWRT